MLPCGTSHVCACVLFALWSVNKIKDCKLSKLHFIYRSVEVSTNGPAVTLLLTNNTNGLRYSIDLTPVIKDESWPEDADEWKSRSRRGITNKTLLFLLFQTWRA